MAYWILAVVLFTGTVYALPSRISGGFDVSLENYPSIVQIEFRNRYYGYWSHGCGGNVLTTKSILTSAQCFEGKDYDQSNRRIRAGSARRNTGRQVGYLSTVLKHPTFDSSHSFDGDIAVVTLIMPLVYSPVVARALLPPQGTLIPNDFPVVLAGYGAPFAGGPLSSNLQATVVFTLDNTLCADIYHSRFNITRNMICAGIIGSGGRGSCQGDAGGPLYFRNITVGVMTLSNGCGGHDSPSVITAVSSYTNWILENTI